MEVSSIPGLAEGRELAGNNIVDKTKAQYQSKLNVIKNWYHEFYPAGLENDDLKLPMDLSSVEACFGYLQFKDPEKGHDKDAERKAVNTFGGYRSAIVHYHLTKGVPVPTELTILMKQLVGGMKRTVARLKKQGIMSIHEGRRELTYAGYRILCSHFIQEKPIGREGSWAQSTFAWSFLTMCWNRMARSNTVAETYITSVEWKNDALVVNLGAHKGDQEGDNARDCHIYANPCDPFVCPILSLAVYILSRYKSKSTQLFEGFDNEKRFSRLLGNILETLPVGERLLLGALPEEIGTHSARKGSPTYCLSFEGVSETAVRLRAGWTLGKVADKYIFQSKFFQLQHE
jgi:hypothetical protein